MSEEKRSPSAKAAEADETTKGVAIDASVQIMCTLVEMLRFIASNAAQFEQIRAVELKLLECQKTTDERFERVFDYMKARETGNRPPRQTSSQPGPAGLFQRMGCRQRRSGDLRKICEMTEIQDNYRPEFLPKSETLPGSFRVTLWDIYHTGTDHASTQAPESEMMPMSSQRKTTMARNRPRVFQTSLPIELETIYVPVYY